MTCTRWLAAGLFALLLAPAAPAAQNRATSRGAAAPKEAGPVAALLMDVRTGQLLYSRDIHLRRPPASTTKILTTIIALERLRPDVPVTIGPRAAAQRSGAAIGLEVDEQWSLNDLLHAMVVRSANDAALAVAEAVAGTAEAFAAEMNRKAKAIGARNSHFSNPHGLPAPDHYSTAYDLALIARYGLVRLPTFASLVRAQSWTLERPDRPSQEYVNTNRLLSRYEGADGVKTGWTAASGFCLVASATRDGWQLLAVVLGSQDMYRDVEQLFNFGFQTFTPVMLAQRGEPVATLDNGWRRKMAAVVAADTYVVVRRGTIVSSQVRLRRDLKPPLAPGVPVGELVFFAGQATLARVPLIAARPPAL